MIAPAAITPPAHVTTDPAVLAATAAAVAPRAIPAPINDGTIISAASMSAFKQADATSFGKSGGGSG